MIKISTLYKKNPENLGRVIDEVNPENQWVFNGEGVATRKFDGTAAAIINGELYKRYDVKKGREVPPGAIPCQEPDTITGHWPHWVEVDSLSKEDKYFREGFINLVTNDLSSIEFKYSTYELCGPKVNGNKEGLDRHELVRHGYQTIHGLDLSFKGLKKFLKEVDYEGIVFHHPDGRMCKIRKSDFGIKRNK